MFKKESLRNDASHVLRGFLMGGADIIPGVSGGTVALILGIYNRLVTAISRVDMVAVRHLRHNDWKLFAEHLDLRFLCALGMGISLGIMSLASLMHFMLDQHQVGTHAVFLGLILASSFLVARMVERWRGPTILCGLVGAIGAFALVGLPVLQSPPESLFYTFFCGVVAICAMILPGISGSFILLILGKYQEITGVLREILHGTASLDSLSLLAVFACGCLLGLLSFAKLLRWLLRRFEAATMALLCGLMIGSLRRIWPFQAGWSENFDGGWIGVLSLTVVGIVVVFCLDSLGRKSTGAAEWDAPPKAFQLSEDRQEQ